MYGLPPIREVLNAIFIPYRENGAWGVFDENCEPIIESADLRGADRTPHLTDLSWPKDTHVDNEAPEPVYMYGGWANPHYGHFLINSLPRFWPFWDASPDIPILCSSSFDSIPPHARSIFRLLGISEERWTYFDQPTRIKRLLVPTPAVLEQYWIYTIYRDLCQRVSRGLWSNGEVDSIARPAYLSKSRLTTGVGRFAAEIEIEDVVRAADIDIFYPEMMSFEEQVRLFTMRRLCIGPTGSAFHTSIFAAPNRNILCFSPARELNSNFSLIDKISDNNSEYFYQDGLTYSSGTNNFLTVVHASDNRQLGADLVALARERVKWA